MTSGVEPAAPAAGASDPLAVLHAHYSETCALIRDKERQRDKLFTSLLVLIGAMFLIAYYPTVLPASVEIASASASVVLKLPSSVLMSVVDLSLLAFSLRYCSYCVLVDRQYEYVATLEDKLSKASGDDSLFRREGRVYNDDYPLVSWLAWAFYTLAFPAIVIVSVAAVTCGSIVNEVRISTVFNAVVGAFVVTTFVFYKAPAIIWRVRQWRRPGPRRHDPSSVGAPPTAHAPAASTATGTVVVVAESPTGSAASAADGGASAT